MGGYDVKGGRAVVHPCRSPPAARRLPLAARRSQTRRGLLVARRLPLAACRLPLAACRSPLAACRSPLADQARATQSACVALAAFLAGRVR